MNHANCATLRCEPQAKCDTPDTLLGCAAKRSAQVTGRLSLTLSGIRALRGRIESALAGRGETIEDGLAVAGQISVPPPILESLEHAVKLLDEIGEQLNALRSIV